MVLVDKCYSARCVVNSSSVCSEVASGEWFMKLQNCR